MIYKKNYLARPDTESHLYRSFKFKQCLRFRIESFFMISKGYQYFCVWHLKFWPCTYNIMWSIDQKCPHSDKSRY